MVLAGHSQISCSCGEKSEEGLRSCYVTGRKLWTWLVRTESTLRTTRKWPGDKATYSPRTEDHIQVATHLMMNSPRDGILCLHRSNEVTWNDLCTCEEVWEYKGLLLLIYPYQWEVFPLTLMNQLVKGMLAISTRLPPHNRSSRVVHTSTLARY